MNDLDQVNVDLPYELAMGDEAGRIEFYKSAQAILKSNLQVIEDHKNLWFRTLSVETERDQIKVELEQLAKKIKHSDYWYGTRYETLFHWAHRELNESQKNQYFSIVANGSAHPDHPPTYAQQMNRLKWKVEAAEKERDMLKVELDRLRTAEGDAMTYKAGMENVAQQRDQLKAELEKVKADRKTCWEEFKVQGRQVDQLKAELEDFKQGAKVEADAGDEAREEARQIKLENEALRKALREVMNQVDGNIRETVRDCVNGHNDVQDIYGYCDAIEGVVGSALLSK